MLVFLETFKTDTSDEWPNIPHIRNVFQEIIRLIVFIFLFIRVLNMMLSLYHNRRPKLFKKSHPARQLCVYQPDQDQVSDDETPPELEGSWCCMIEVRFESVKCQTHLNLESIKNYKHRVVQFKSYQDYQYSYID